MLIQNIWGQCLCSQKIIPGDTATAFSPSCYQYWEYFLLCDGVDNDSDEIPAGGIIMGQTSKTTAIVLSNTVDVAWGSVNTRVTLRLRSLSGSFTQGEDLGYGANLNHLTVRANTVERRCQDDYMYKGKMACTAVVQVINQTALVSLTPAIPNQTALIGIRLVANSDLQIQDTCDIMNFKVIDYASGSASTILANFWFV